MSTYNSQAEAYRPRPCHNTNIQRHMAEHLEVHTEIRSEVSEVLLDTSFQDFTTGVSRNQTGNSIESVNRLGFESRAIMFFDLVLPSVHKRFKHYREYKIPSTAHCILHKLC